MWTRSVLKENAKNNLRGKYWTAFAVALIVRILGSGSSGWGVSGTGWKMDSNQGDWDFFNSQWLLIIILIIIVVFILAMAFTIFVSNLVTVGGNRWFSRNRESAATPSVGMVFSLFKSGSYLKTAGSMLWMELFLFLWSLLPLIPLIAGAAVLAGVPGLTEEIYNLFRQQDFDRFKNWLASLEPGLTLSLSVLPLLSALLSIPYIIKSYSYRMTPWILADNPQIGYRRALRLSMKMTRGSKWTMFVLDLSFLGWRILGALACGIGVLFVTPYIMATHAELYATLRQYSVAAGSCTMEELGFIPVNPQMPQTF
ncbi:MAG TPA: hypothetical protein DCM45_06425 [Clostridiales bacterium]|nr:hypothetical protein [Clostridiales bacterium]